MPTAMRQPNMRVMKVRLATVRSVKKMAVVASLIFSILGASSALAS